MRFPWNYLALFFDCSKNLTLVCSEHRQENMTKIFNVNLIKIWRWWVWWGGGGEGVKIASYIDFQTKLQMSVKTSKKPQIFNHISPHQSFSAVYNNSPFIYTNFRFTMFWFHFKISGIFRKANNFQFLWGIHCFLSILLSHFLRPRPKEQKQSNLRTLQLELLLNQALLLL